MYIELVRLRNYGKNIISCHWLKRWSLIAAICAEVQECDANEAG
jgi:hypothetical protein